MALVSEKKGGPYSKNEKAKRQNEVFRLHFDLGYSAVKISEMMKINRNTINSDINHLYHVLSKEWDSHDIDSWGMKQIHRLESQRTRLFKDLDKTENLSIRLSIEKTILDIDTKIMNFVTKTISTKEHARSIGIQLSNQWAKEKKLDLAFMDPGSLLDVSIETHDKIETLLKEDVKNKRGMTKFD